MCSFRLHKNTCHYDSKRFCHFCTKRIREKKKLNKNTVCHRHSIDIFNSRVNNFAYGRSVDSRKCSNVRQVDQCLSESLMIAKYFGCICTHNVNVFVWSDMSQHCNHNYRCFSHSVRRSNCSHSYIIFFVFFITFWLSEVLPLVVRYSHPSISFPIFSRFLFLLMSIISISRFLPSQSLIFADRCPSLTSFIFVTSNDISFRMMFTNIVSFSLLRQFICITYAWRPHIHLSTVTVISPAVESSYSICSGSMKIHNWNFQFRKAKIHF